MIGTFRYLIKIKHWLINDYQPVFDNLRAEADYDLARRSITGVFAFVLPWLIIYYASGLEQANKVLLEFLGFMLAATSVGRLYLASNFKKLYSTNSQLWRWLFSIEAVFSAAIWSGVCALALNSNGISTIFVLVMLSTAVIAAGSIVSLAPAPKLGGVFVVLLFLPIIPFMLFSDEASKRGIGLLFLTFFILMFLMWIRLHAEYWRALSVRTELRKAKEVAEEASAAKGIFIASVSHELRTPLTAVIGSLGMINDYLSDGVSPEAKKLVDMAYQNGKRLSVLINDILDFEKLNAHRMEFNLQPLALTPFINNAVQLNQSFAAGFRVVLHFEHPAFEVKVVADEQRLMQVMTNLLSNAAKHSPVGEQVMISVEKNERSVRVAIKNIGEGVPVFFRPHIFEKFSQADSSGARKNNGTGLGLAISKEIINQMGGDINFQSEIGQGAVFYFDLPIEESYPPTQETV